MIAVLHVSDDLDEGDEGRLLDVVLPPEAQGERLDRALAAALPELSRARVQALIAGGAVSLDGQVRGDAAARAGPGVYVLRIPAPAAAEPLPQELPLPILYEDDHLIVADKPAGMAAHPAPGTPDGTLVNALLHHCAGSLSGIGGVARPGIVHRLDKLTSGVIVAAKSDAAHRGLAALFAAHDIERAYTAFVRGAPEPPRGTVVAGIGRALHDRKKMAVLRTGGWDAITHYGTQQVYGPAGRPSAAKLTCRLETGRTHQIRVHLASRGTPVLGDPVYGSGAPAEAVREAIAAAGLERQALHAAVLGFVHPLTGERLRFETSPPEDMSRLESELGARFFAS